MENFIGFYPSRPFWAETKAEFHLATTQKEFNETMNTIVYQKTDGDTSLKICRDGQILLRIKKLERVQYSEEMIPTEEAVKRQRAYLEYMNSFYLLLDSALVETQKFCYFNLHEITGRDIFSVTIKDGTPNSWSVPQESVASVFLSARDFHSYNADIPIEHDQRMRSRIVVSSNSLLLAGENFFRALSDPNTVKYLSSLAKSLSEYKSGNYDISIILSWFIIESILNKLWSKHLTSLHKSYPNGRSRINSKRKESIERQLNNIGSKTSMLELFEILDFDTFEKIEEARDIRNKIAHRDKFSSSPDMAVRTIDLAKNMISDQSRINIEPNFSFTLLIL